MSKLKICICGGGALGHVISGVLAHSGNYDVHLLTGHPGLWGNEVKINLPDEKEIIGSLAKISADPREVVSEVDHVILCLPGYLIASVLGKIRPYLKEGAVVGSVVSSNGFFWIARSILPKKNPYWGLQRVPYIARVIQYGAHAELKGYKSQLKIAISENGNRDAISKIVENFFSTPTVVLQSFWAAALTNSNPLLHTCRLYTLFNDYIPGTVYEERPLFYEDWDNDSSRLLIACDVEFQQIIPYLPVTAQDIPSLLNYYESSDAESLTRKLKSIEAFKGIRLSMIKTSEGYIPDWNNRYFTEDIPFGLLIIKSVAHYFNILTPNIDRVLYWSQDRMGKEYIIKGALTGKDIVGSGVPQNYLSSLNELLYQNAKKS